MSETLMSEEVEPTASRRGLLLALAGVGAALLAGLLLWAFVLGGDDDVFEPIPSAADTEGSTEEAPATDVADESASPPVETVEVFLSRDPFQPVRPPAAPGVVDGGDTGVEPGPTDPTDPSGPTDPTDPSDPTDPAPPGDGSPPAPKDGDDSATVEGHEVELIDVFEENGVRRVTIRVDSTLYTVSEGEEFAGNFRVLSIDPPCATLLYGDNQFTLCEGERVRK